MQYIDFLGRYAGNVCWYTEMYGVLAQQRKISMGLKNYNSVLWQATVQHIDMSDIFQAQFSNAVPDKTYTHLNNFFIEECFWRFD